jgi:hypothetical protein
MFVVTSKEDIPGGYTLTPGDVCTMSMKFSHYPHIDFDLNPKIIKQLDDNTARLIKDTENLLNRLRNIPIMLPNDTSKIGGWFFSHVKYEESPTPRVVAACRQKIIKQIPIEELKSDNKTLFETSLPNISESYIVLKKYDPFNLDPGMVGTIDDSARLNFNPQISVYDTSQLIKSNIIRVLTRDERNKLAEAYKLTGKTFKVFRSNGQLEDGWTLLYVVGFVDNEIQVKCNIVVEKSVDYRELLRLNPSADEAQAKKKEEERLKAEAEAKKKEEEERLKAEAEAKKKEEEEKLKAEAEAKKKKEEEERLKAEAEAKKKKDEEERLKAEAEARKKEEEKLKAEAEARKKEEEEEEERFKAEAKSESKRKEEEMLKAEAEAEAKKKKDEKERPKAAAEDISFEKIGEANLIRICKTMDELLEQKSVQVREDILESNYYFKFKNFCSRIALRNAIDKLTEELIDQRRKQYDIEEHVKIEIYDEEDEDAEIEFLKKYFKSKITVSSFKKSGSVIKKNDYFGTFDLVYTREGTRIAEFKIPMWCEVEGSISFIHKLVLNSEVKLNVPLATLNKNGKMIKEIKLDEKFGRSYTSPPTLDHKIEVVKDIQNMNKMGLGIQMGGCFQKRARQRNTMKIKSKSKNNSKSKSKNNSKSKSKNNSKSKSKRK